ncbi:MAG TPA: hypothetical protein VHO48_12830, partial [Anaerolineaceae bacterium]|nr:hypothetical protein [Anaerolineaceae bacterium]
GVGFCFSIINSILGLTKVHWRRAPSHEVILLAFSSACSTLIMILVENHLWPGSSLPLAMQIFAGVLSFLGFTFLRYRERVLTGFATIWLSFRKSNQAMGEKVLLVGAGRNSQLAIWFLTHSEFARLFRIVGIVDDDPRKQGMYFDGFRVIGTTRDIPDLVDKYKVSKTIFAITNISEKERQRIIWTCQSAKTSLVVFPDVMAELTLRFQAAAVKNQGLYSTVGD